MGSVHTIPTGYSGNYADLSAADTPSLTKGPDRDAVLLQKLKRWFRDSWKASETWRSEAVTNLKMVGNQQWDEQTLANLEDRPALTINKMLSPLLYLSGIEVQNRVDPTLLPIETGDLRAAELMTPLLKWVNHRCQEGKLNTRLFLDKLVTGIAWKKARLCYDAGPEPYPEWERCHPLSVFPDPNWFDLDDWSKASYAFHVQLLAKDEATALYPAFEDEIEQRWGEWIAEAGAFSSDLSTASRGTAIGDSQSDNRMFFDKDTARVRLVEGWWLERITVHVALFGDQVEGDPARVKRMMILARANPEAAKDITFVPQIVTKCYRGTFMMDILLDTSPSPFTAQVIPMFPDLAYYFWNRPCGPAGLMVDLQREKNKRRSTLVELVQKTPNSGWLNKRNGGAKNQDIIDYAHGTSPVITFDEEAPTMIAPPQLPPTVVYLENKSDEDIRDVTGVNREQTGNATQKTISGRAIVARQRGGMTTQESLYDGTRQSREPAYKFMVQAIQQFISVDKALRILGTMAQRQAQTPPGVAAPTQLAPLQQLMATLPDQALVELLQNTMLTEFDVVIDQSQAYEATQKVARWDTLQDIAANFPGQIPPDVLVEAATDAGLLTESQGLRTKAWIAQQQQAAQQPPGAKPRSPANDQRSEPAAAIQPNQ